MSVRARRRRLLTFAVLPSVAALACGRTPASVGFSPDGEYLAAAGNGYLTVWRLPAGQVLLRTPQRGRVHTDPLAFSPDGRTVAVGARGIAVAVLKPSPRAFSLNALIEVDDLEFCRDGRVIAARVHGISVSLYDADSGAMLLSYVGGRWHRGLYLPPFPTGPVTAPVAFTCSGPLLVIARHTGAGSHAALFDIDRLLRFAARQTAGADPPVATLLDPEPRGMGVRDIAVVNESRVALCMNNTLRVVDVRAGREMARLPLPGCRAITAAPARPPRIVVLDDTSGLTLFDLDARSARPLGSALRARSIALRRDGGALAVGTAQTVSVWGIGPAGLTHRGRPLRM
ncbi:MAG TPA: hypothetical protein VF006_17985 [Longimicrobium sp.]